MEKSKNKWINILRWVLIIPVVIIVYLLFKVVYSFIANFIVSEIITQFVNNLFENDNKSYDYIYQINHSKDFAGHYLIGSIYIFTRELIGVVLVIFSGTYLAPSHKKQVGYSLIILLIITAILLFIFTIVTKEEFLYTTETIIRIIVENLGMIVGIYFAWKNLSSIKNIIPNS